MDELNIDTTLKYIGHRAIESVILLDLLDAFQFQRYGVAHAMHYATATYLHLLELIMCSMQV